MIVWIASYPRSGNTFLRVVLKEVFGLDSYSIHGDRKDIATHGDTRKIVGHLELNDDLDELRKSPELKLVKTHGPPANQTDKAIYLIRDGRDAIASYSSYISEFRNEKATVADLISSVDVFGGWASHIEAWNPRARKNTLCVQFEELVSDPEKYIPELSSFLGRTPKKNPDIPDFARLHDLNPEFFRKGMVGKWESNLTRKELMLFELKSAHVLREFDYPLLFDEELTDSRFRDFLLTSENDDLANKVAKLQESINKQSRALSDLIKLKTRELETLKNRVDNVKLVFNAAERAKKVRIGENPIRFLSRRIKLVFAALFKL